ncbi:MAG: queuosine salvage family protein, partial [Actinomycetota bacterium]
MGADEETRCLFVLALDAINFGSGWFPLLDKRPGHSGYHTIAAGLADHATRDGLVVDDLLAMTPERIAAVVGQRPDGPVGPLMAEFARSLVLLGELLRDVAGGSATRFVASADRSAAELAASLVAGHPMYEDAPDLRGRPVPLYKRAQITVADLHHAFGGTGPGRFDDLDRLTMFADNLVPHVLRLDGVLRFDDALVDRIDAGDLLAPGEPAEVEIRAVAVHAVELIVGELRDADGGLSAMDLDGLLW